ncbi:MAG: GNAT family N-acetyltransferase [Maricaulaceae bacterium]|nr:GNAT family N-acetyltransferase [Maricaulaceae bacterium]
MSPVVASLSRFGLRKAGPEDIPALHALAKDLILGEIVSPEIMLRVDRWSGQTLFIRETGGEMTGFLAYIPLTEAGRKATIEGRMTAANIRKSWVAAPGQYPAALLNWGMGGRTAKDRVALITAMVRSMAERYPDVPSLSRARTPEGLRMIKRMGFRLAYQSEGRDDLWARDEGMRALIEERKSAAGARIRSTNGAAPPVSVRVAHTLDEVVMALTLRGVIYLGEQAAPYHEEYDGNDLAAATHLIARVGGEPAGVLRLRWFADFAKVERAAVLDRFRRNGVMRRLMEEALAHCARRGYCYVLGHAQIGKLDYWRSFGFHRRDERPSFWFSDYEYAEIEIRLDPPPDAITRDTPPLVIIRPEGEWDRPGNFDRSLARLGGVGNGAGNGAAGRRRPR